MILFILVFVLPFIIGILLSIKPIKKDLPNWRVTYYKDGRTTRKLKYEEAKNLAEIFKGELWYDNSNK